jgi:hypothetical protein
VITIQNRLPRRIPDGLAFDFLADGLAPVNARTVSLNGDQI